MLLSHVQVFIAPGVNMSMYTSYPDEVVNENELAATKKVSVRLPINLIQMGSWDKQVNNISE